MNSESNKLTGTDPKRRIGPATGIRAAGWFIATIISALFMIPMCLDAFIEFEVEEPQMTKLVRSFSNSMTTFTFVFVPVVVAIYVGFEIALYKARENARTLYQIIFWGVVVVLLLAQWGPMIQPTVKLLLALAGVSI